MPSQAIRSIGLATWLHSDTVKTSHWNDRAIRIPLGNALAEWKGMVSRFCAWFIIFSFISNGPVGSLLNIKGTSSTIKTDPLLLLYFSYPQQNQSRQLIPLLTELIHIP